MTNPKRRYNPPGTGQLPPGEALPEGALLSPDRFVCTLHEGIGLWHRPVGTDDPDIVKEARSSFKPIPWDQFVGCTYLDLGAHIGIFTMTAVRHGAGLVVAVEPDPDSFWLLEQNTCEVSEHLLDAVTTVWAAANDTGDDAVLYRNLDGIGKCMNSIVTKGSKVPMIVPGVALNGLLDAWEPTFIKVDIEYAEYQLSDLYRLPACVEGLFIELHLNSGTHRQQGQGMYASFLDQGFKPVREARFTQRNWSTCPILVRGQAAKELDL